MLHQVDGGVCAVCVVQSETAVCDTAGEEHRPNQTDIT